MSPRSIFRLLPPFVGRLFDRPLGTAATVTIVGLVVSAVLVVIAIVIALVILWFVLSVLVWNAFLVPATGAQVVVFGLGMFLFWAGVAFFGRFVGFFALVGALILFFTGGSVHWLDMTMTAGPLALYGVFMVFFGGPRGGSRSSHG